MRTSKTKMVAWGKNGLNQGSNGDHEWLPTTPAMEAQASIFRTTLLDFEGCSDKVDALAPRWSIIVRTIGRLFFFLHL